MFHKALGWDFYIEFTNDLVDVRLCFGRGVCTISVRIQVKYLRGHSGHGFQFHYKSWVDVQ